MMTVPATSPASARSAEAVMRRKTPEPSGRRTESVPSQSLPRQAWRSRCSTLPRSSGSKPSSRKAFLVRCSASGYPNSWAANAFAYFRRPSWSTTITPAATFARMSPALGPAPAFRAAPAAAMPPPPAIPASGTSPAAIPARVTSAAGTSPAGARPATPLRLAAHILGLIALPLRAQDAGPGTASTSGPAGRSVTSGRGDAMTNRCWATARGSTTPGSPTLPAPVTRTSWLSAARITSRPGCMPMSFSLSIRATSLCSCSPIRWTIIRAGAGVASAGMADPASQQGDQAPFHLVGDHVLPAAGLDVDLLPRQANDVDEQALGKPVLAHHPGRPRLALGGQRQPPVGADLEQAIALHPGHGLADRRATVPEPLGDPRAARLRALLGQLVDRAEVHLRRVDQALRRHRGLPPPHFRCYGHAGRGRPVSAPGPGRLPGPGSRGQPLHHPSAVLLAVPEPVVHAVRAAVPELEGPGDQQVPAPELRKRHRLALRPAGGHPRVPVLQLAPRADHSGLPARPRRQLRPARPGAEVLRALGLRQPRHLALHDHLPVDRVPGEEQAGTGNGVQIASLPRRPVGVEAKALPVVTLEQDHPRARPARGRDRGEHHRGRLGQPRRDHVRHPPVELVVRVIGQHRLIEPLGRPLRRVAGVSHGYRSSHSAPAPGRRAAVLDRISTGRKLGGV